YAILSHVWGTNEQTFQDLCSISERCKSTGENPRDLMGPKIKGCCLLAAQLGLLWIWIDTGCIDKTSSAELSEAINSMFQWYKQADVCYAYLADAVHSPFRRSIWHTRGWTLQELIAPEVVVFLSPDWKVLGDKVHLAPLLEQITNVPRAVLHHQVELSTVSVAQRMSWAAHRKTTRLEDEAYCLLGIFSINMPTLYGEGRAAFRRLQEEIMQTSTDLSLLAW
ncbi:HET-domain-containing protein, partial [Trametes versicolor FP-101664 SS1]|uniref:HET-domain-containing protein n=1 Tax=Trametes versicolor (strain FP-101664) TaxID=717944 RepID=UPI00046236D2